MSQVVDLTPLHDNESVLKRLIASSGAAMRHVRANAEQFAAVDPWGVLLRHVCARIAPRTGPRRRQIRGQWRWGNCRI